MKKKIVVAAIAATLATPMVANAEAIMYGKVRVASQSHDRGDRNFDGQNNDDSWGMEDHSSRLGVKGEEDLGNGLKGIFQLEFGVNVGEGFGGKSRFHSHGLVDVNGNPVLDPNGDPFSTTSASNTDFLSQRNSFVGLAGPFGTVLAGRHDTPFKMSTMNLDFFADTSVDNDDTASFVSDTSTQGVGLFHSLRVDGAIAYVSPSFAGFQLLGAVVQVSADSDFEHADRGAGAYSLAATYTNGPFYGAAAYETLEPDNLSGTTVSPDYKKWKVGFGILDFNNISAAVVYEERTDTLFIPGFDTNSWQFSAAYDIMGMLKVKGMYGQFIDDSAVAIADFDTWAIGLEHKFSKRTDVQFIYRQKEFDNNTLNTLFEDNVFALQVDHSF